MEINFMKYNFHLFSSGNSQVRRKMTPFASMKVVAIVITGGSGSSGHGGGGYSSSSNTSNNTMSKEVILVIHAVKPKQLDINTCRPQLICRSAEM